MASTDSPLYLGFDLSTQSLTAIAIDSALKVYKHLTVNFDTLLPHYKTKGGAIRGDDGVTVTSPTMMWVEAIDHVLTQLKNDNFPFKQVRAVSASGQQHGSVYWKVGASKILEGLNPEKNLKDQLSDAFAIGDSPIWMDSSTTKYCREIEDLMGGPDKVAAKTGSISFERFTVNQIAKIYRTNPNGYASTERISLVSSFFASLFLGKYAAIDPADGSGMNAMDIHSKTWIQPILEYAAPGLAEKLGEVKDSHSVLGNVTPYLQKRYGFDSSCQIIASSGDNPCTLAGLKLRVGDIVISLGTSATMFGPLTDPKPNDEGNIVCNPIDPKGFMAMLCYKNSALVREHVRDLHVDKSWDRFSETLRSTPPGNNGHVGFYFQEHEIIPHKKGFFYFTPEDVITKDWDDGKLHVRGVVESQALSMLVHSTRLGLKAENGIFVTGGASTNKEIIQIFSDVFGVPAFTGEVSNSAALGAAYRALHGWECSRAGKFVPFEEVVGAPQFQKSTDPNPQHHKLYGQLATRYKKLEDIVISQH